MVQRIRAHFDGRVIVPDEPVNLPANEPLDVQVTTAQGGNGRIDPRVVQERLQALRGATGILSAPAPSDEALRRENLYD